MSPARRSGRRSPSRWVRPPSISIVHGRVAGEGDPGGPAADVEEPPAVADRDQAAARPDLGQRPDEPGPDELAGLAEPVEGEPRRAALDHHPRLLAEGRRVHRQPRCPGDEDEPPGGRLAERRDIGVADEPATDGRAGAHGLRLERRGDPGEVDVERGPLGRRPAAEELRGRPEERRVLGRDGDRPVWVDAHDEPAPVIRVGLAPDDPPPLEPIEDARDRAARQPGQLGQPRRGDLVLADRELEALEVRRVDPDPFRDGLVEDDGAGDQAPPGFAGIGSRC